MDATQALKDTENALRDLIADVLQKKFGEDWGKANEFTVAVRMEDIGKYFEVNIEIRSPRAFHAHGDHDDSIVFDYEVLPPKASRG